MKTAPENPWGGCLLRLNASGDNRPGAQGKLTLRARLHIPVSFRAVPERHDSMIRGTHRRRNAIFAHLLPGQSHMFGAHPRSPVGSARRDTRIAPRPRRPDLRCARGGVQPGRAAARLRQVGRHGPARDLCPATGRARPGYDRARILFTRYTGWQLHQLRHSAATHLGEQGIPLQLIIAKTRHRNPRTAMRYVRLGAEAVAEITGLLEPPRRRG
jgi:hypothetical protein